MTKQAICIHCHESREQLILLGMLVALGCHVSGSLDECWASDDGKHDFRKAERTDRNAEAP